MAIKKAKIGDAIYDITEEEEYLKNPEMYSQGYTAIDGGDGCLYPVRTNMNDFRPGFYDIGPMVCYKPPADSERYMYSSQNIIDFSAAGCIKDIIKAQSSLASAERAILTTIDSVFIPPKSDADTPEMGLLKQAIIDKHVDLDKYEQRFQANYNNDKRLLKKNRITFDKLRDICNNLDISAVLTLEDRTPDVPNPMKHKISVCITDGFDAAECVEAPEGE